MSSMTERFWAKVDKDGPVIIQSLGPCWMTRIRPNGTRACRTCAREMNRGNVNAAYWRDYRARRTAEGRPVGRAS